MFYSSRFLCTSVLFVLMACPLFAQVQEKYRAGTNAQGNVEINNGNNKAILFSTQRNEWVRIDSLGRLGIGTSTPAQTLHVVGRARVATADNLNTLGVNQNMLAIDENGDLRRFTGTSLNIYNSDGTLSGNRVVTQGANMLSFTSTAVNAFNVNNNTFSVDASNSRVGIGTTSPAQALHVVGRARVTTADNLNTLGANQNMLAIDENGDLRRFTGAIPNIYNSDGTLSGNRVITQGANTLSFTSTAVNGFNVDNNTLSVDASNNRVGIGTNTPSQPLEVVGNARISGNTFNVDATNSRVGIGTTSPSTSLQVVGITTTDNLNIKNLERSGTSTDSVLTVDPSNGNVNRLSQTPFLTNIYNSDGQLSNHRTVEMANSSFAFLGGGMSAPVVIRLAPSSTTNSIKSVSMSAPCNLGYNGQYEYVFPNVIPGDLYPLTLDKGNNRKVKRVYIRIDYSSPITIRCRMIGRATGNTNDIYLSKQGENSWMDLKSGQDYILEDFIDTKLRSVNFRGNIVEPISYVTFTLSMTVLYETEDNVPIFSAHGDALTILQNKNVGIGTSSPTQTLDVSGNANKTVGGTAWTNVSDSRLKENVHDYKRGLAEILQINPVYYDYTENSNLKPKESYGQNVGIIAQDVEKIIPEAIHTRPMVLKDGTQLKDGKELVMADAMWFALINATKELHGQINQLKTDNDKMKKVNIELQKENQEMKQQIQYILDKLK